MLAPEVRYFCLRANHLWRELPLALLALVMAAPTNPLIAPGVEFLVAETKRLGRASPRSTSFLKARYASSKTAGLAALFWITLANGT